MGWADTLASVMPIVMVFVVYAATVVVCNLAAQPLRRRMFALINELLHAHEGPADQAKLNYFMDSCMSTRVAVLVPIAAFSVFFDLLMGREMPAQARNGLRADSRFHDVLGMYFISVLAATPLAAVLTVPVIFLILIAKAFMGGGDIKETVEEPALRAANRACTI